MVEGVEDEVEVDLVEFHGSSIPFLLGTLHWVESFFYRAQRMKRPTAKAAKPTVGEARRKSAVASPRTTTRAMSLAMKVRARESRTTAVTSRAFRCWAK